MVLFVRAVVWLLGASLVTSGALAASAQTPPGEQALVRRIPRIEGSGVKVDGKLDEPVWRAALEIPLDFESQPGDGIAPPVATKVFLVHDDHQLYIAFEASDPEPDKIRAQLMDRDLRDTFEQDDYVAILLDTYNDSRRGFEFRVNPRGVQMDGIYDQQQDRDFSWNGIWDSAGSIGPGGYLVELAIPFHQLRFLDVAGEQVWGIGLSRSWPRDVLHRFEAHEVDRDNTCVLCQVPRFVGFEGLAQGRHLEVTPTLTFEHTDRARTPGAGLESGDEDIEAGASLRWGLTPSLNLNATFNPDFSQVEADALQLETNTTFALQFEEKRPFFLEGQEIFFSPVLAVFTRTVVDPVWGLKLTGKPAPRSTLGFFVVEDEVNNLILPRNDGSSFGRLPGKASTLVGRFRQDIGKSSQVGGLYTRREGEDGYLNQVGGFDALLRPGDRHQVYLQALASKTAYPEEWVGRLGQRRTDIEGEAIEALYSYEARNWQGSLGWRSYDQDFRADAGFVPRVDFQTWRASGGRTFWSDDPEAFFNKIELDLTYFHTRDQAGRLTDDKWDLLAVFQMPLQSKLTLESIYRDERRGPVLFENLSSQVLKFEIQPSELGKFAGALTVGDAVDYANQRPADEIRCELDVEVKPGLRWNTGLRLIDHDLDAGGGRLVDTRLADLKATYNFNRRAFLRAIVQYVEVEFEEANDPSGREDLETLASQLLFSYKINPQTLLYLGYSDGYIAVEEPEIPGQPGIYERHLEIDRRTFFLKMSYAFTR
jgi:hypothetical protein